MLTRGAGMMRPIACVVGVGALRIGVGQSSGRKLMKFRERQAKQSAKEERDLFVDATREL